MRFEHIRRIRSLAVVGATGLVGREFLNILEESEAIADCQLRLYASGRSAGQAIDVLGKSYTVEELSPSSFDGVEAAFFTVPTQVSREFVPIAAHAGTVVVDDSSAFRMSDTVPLVVPEINRELLRDFTGKIIATPNCSTTPLVQCLHPIADRYGISRVVVSTYQSVSGAGSRAYGALSEQSASLLSGRQVETDGHRFAFNCIPFVGEVADGGSSSEEEKIARETAKILDLPDLAVHATAVRVPTFCGHGLSVAVELTSEFGDIREIRELLDHTPGLKVIDQPSAQIYPTNREAVGEDLTFVGRLRRDPTVRSGIAFWAIADNLRKGAALNAIEILETLYSFRSVGSAV